MAEDFIKDGLLHCGVCGKPKEYRYDVFGITSIANARCDCEFAEIETRQNQWKKEQRLIQINNMRVDCIRDRERRSCRFETAEWNPQLEKCKKYADNFTTIKQQNAGLLMWGPCGNGKSFAAACIANELIDREIPALMTSFPTILAEDISTVDLARQMNYYDLVVLDDLGAERQSQYALEKVFFVIDERYKSHKPLIVTTNLDFDTMMNYAYGKGGNTDYKRIYDRVLEMCTSMPFMGETRRKPIMRKNVNVLSDIFRA